MNHPAAAEVDPGVADRGRLGARAGRAEEEDVAGSELGEADPLRGRDLPAHLVGGASLDRRGERGAAGIGLQLVDPPDEARAVEAAVRLPAGWFVRSPSSRATVSLPKREGVARPAASAAAVKAAAASERSRARTRRASSWVTVTVAEGVASVAAGCLVSPPTTAASSPRVRVSSARK